MQKVSTTPTIKPFVRFSAARLSILSGAAALALLAGLHLLSPEFDPARRMVSEYALGAFPWVLALFFLTWAASTAALFVTLRPLGWSTGGKIGLGFLLLSALGMGMAAVFDFRHGLHGLAALIGIPSLPVAAMLISARLARRPGWEPARRALRWTAHLTWISLVLMFAAMFAGMAMSSGNPEADLLIGWPNRLLVVAYCAWIITAARWTLRLER